jgi:copper chaperone CopZ
MTRLLPLVLALLAAGCAAAPDSHTSSENGAAVTSRTEAASSTGAAPTTGGETRRPATAPPELITLEVGGMTCAGCVARVQHSLSQVAGVHRVDVNLDDQKAVVLAEPGVPDTALTGAVRRAGSEFLGIVVAR